MCRTRCGRHFLENDVTEYKNSYRYKIYQQTYSYLTIFFCLSMLDNTYPNNKVQLNILKVNEIIVCTSMIILTYDNHIQNGSGA